MKLITVLCFFISLTTHQAWADSKVNQFHTDSYEQLLSAHKNNAFVLILWSVDCSSCLKEMSLLNRIHKDNPQLKMVMLATDSPAEIDQINKYQTQFQLSDIEQWVFADENAQKLRFKLDPRWYGELPRTYFYNKEHQRTGFSGVLKEEHYQQQINKILNLPDT